MAKKLKKVSHQRIYRWLTTPIHCAGTTVSGWASCAATLRRAQVHDRQQFGTRSWEDYPSNRWGWITDKGRCLGAGRRPTKALKSDEILLAIELPFAGGGRELRSQAEAFMRRLNRARSKQGQDFYERYAS